MIMCEFAAEKTLVLFTATCIFTTIVKFIWLYENPVRTVSASFGQVNTEKYAPLIQAFVLPMYFNKNFYALRSYASLQTDL